MRLFMSTFVSAVLLFFVGFVWWGLLMPSVQPTNILTDVSVVNSMSERLKNPGLYVYPDYTDSAAASAEPVAFLYYYPTQPSIGTMMGLGFLHMLVTTLVASLMTKMVRIPSFFRRYSFVLCLGLLIAIWADVGNFIWWRYPATWSAFHFAYDVFSWAVAGLVIATFTKPDTATTPTAVE